MKVKKYIAASMPEAMKQIRAELGNDAIILNSKVVYTGGFLGLLKKRKIEVLAVMDANVEANKHPLPMNKESIPLKKKETNIDTHDIKEQVVSPLPGQSEDLANEINELKLLIQNMQVQKQSKVAVYPIPLQLAVQKLETQGVDSVIQESIFAALLEKWYLKGANATTKEVFAWLELIMVEQITNISYGGISFNKKFVNVVGPTGVGKTTTLAKMAAESVIKHHKSVAFITTDTYRIAAIDQLQTYAKILDVPLEVCYTSDDFKNAVQKMTEYDVIFIDTAGRNFRNQQYVEDLRKTIDFENEMETFLVLSLTAKQQDMEDIFQQFSLIEIEKFIFTKADETSTFGSMYNLIHKYKKGVAYITNGQDVPDDMMAASPLQIVKKMTGVDSDE